MTAILLLIPILSALLGWLIIRIISWLLFNPADKISVGPFVWQGMIYRKEPEIKEQLVALVIKEMPAIEEGATRLVTSANLDSIRPELNDHIDMFLKVKLKQSMPVIGSLIGERTIGQLKALFMEELETLFPSVMTSYISRLKHDIDLNQLVRQKVYAYSFAAANNIIKNNLSASLRKLSLMAAFVGFIFGCMESLIINFWLS